MSKLPDLRNLIEEAKRRKVFRVASWYLVTAWGAALGASELFQAFDISTQTTKLFIIGLILGFPIAVALAWVYELSSDGVAKDVQDRNNVNGKLPAGGEPDHETLAALLAGSELGMTWTDADGEPREQTFTSDFHIGRDAKCELQLNDPMISRLHAEIRFTRGHWWLHDAGSRNGTTLNGSVVDQSELPMRGEIQFYDEGPVLQFEVQQTGADTIMAPKASH